MKNERIFKVLKGPHVSEKSTRVGEKNNQVVFKVACDATKYEIKSAVQELFKVDVEAVTVLNVKGKEKRFRQTVGRRKDWKKAYVTLKSGQDINFLAAE